MLLMGDERRRTQQGNNNAYCQNNEVSWLDWQTGQTAEDILRFTRSLIALRRRHAALHRTRFFTGKPVDARGIADVSWYDPRGYAMDWSKTDSGLTCWLTKPIGVASQAKHDELGDILIMVNPTSSAIPFVLPKESQSLNWRLFADTAKPSPGDVYPELLDIADMEPIQKALKTPVSRTIRVMHRSMMIWLEVR